MTAPATSVLAADLNAAVVSATVVAALVGALSSFFTQRYLLSRKAQVDYEYMARKRLYDAIGPLRMQLLFAARDVVGRVRPHPATPWQMSPTGHFGRSTIYRLLRPLAVAQLIERQMGFADFSVDADALALLRFQRAAERMLTGDDIILGHLTENPLFWLRVVGQAYACNQLIATQGDTVGFEYVPLPVAELLSAADDDFIAARLSEYVRVLDDILARGL